MFKGELPDDGKKFESSQDYRKLQELTNRNIVIQRHLKTAQLWLQYVDMCWWWPTIFRSHVETTLTALGNTQRDSDYQDYNNMVRLLRQFIKAERTGIWKLHLLTI